MNKILEALYQYLQNESFNQFTIESPKEQTEKYPQRLVRVQSNSMRVFSFSYNSFRWSELDFSSIREEYEWKT